MNDRITTRIFDKVMSGDFTAELSMPDYEPEVRRLLRVSLTLTPPEGFCDGSRAGMGGEMIFHILYSGNDGSLYSVSTTENYELAEALRQNEKCTDEVALICDVTPESLVSRAVAPRKISLKCKLRGRIRGFEEKELAERATYIENPDSIERLIGENRYTRIYPTMVGKITLSDDFEAEIPSGLSGELRVISCDGTVALESAEAARDEAIIKGVLHLNLLATLDDFESSPFRMTKKIPFSEVIDTEGLTPECHITARAVCVNTEISLDENRIFCEPVLAVAIDAEEEVQIEYTKDLFSTEVSSATTAKRWEFPISEKIFSGNVSVSARESLESLGIEPDGEIIDVYASAVAKNLDTEGEKRWLSGDVSFNFLVKSGGEYAVRESKVPFKYELDGSANQPDFADFGAIALSPRAKHDGERLSFDCEVGVWGRICSAGELTALDEAIFGEPIVKDGVLTVCFPAPSDSLWEVAKRYRVPIDEIISKNPDAFRGETPISPLVI